MLLALLFGSIVGLTLGILGGGGSTLAVPLLAYGLGLEPRVAIATSLVVVGLAALAGAAGHWRSGTIDFPAALTFGLLGFLGSAGGAQAARFLHPPVQMTLFALTLITAASLMLRPSSRGTASGVPEGRSKRHVAAAALGTGLLTGIVGVGGGFVVVPALVSVAGMPLRRAIGTSLLVIAFNALGGVASYVSYVSLPRAVWVPFAAGAVLAAVAGAGIGRRLAEARLRTAFAVGLILLGIFTIAREVFLVWAS